MAAVPKGPFHLSLLNSAQKASRYATRRQINSADGSIVACKLQKPKDKLSKDLSTWVIYKINCKDHEKVYIIQT